MGSIRQVLSRVIRPRPSRSSSFVPAWCSSPPPPLGGADETSRHRQRLGASRPWGQGRSRTLIAWRSSMALVGVGDLREPELEVEHLAGLDRAVQHVGQAVRGCSRGRTRHRRRRRCSRRRTQPQQLTSKRHDRRACQSLTGRSASGHRVEISSGRSPDFSVLPNVLLGTPRRVNQGRKRTGSSASFGRAMHFLSDGGSHLLRMCLLWRCRYTCWCPAARVTEP